jgi:hypothetical protein
MKIWRVQHTETGGGPYGDGSAWQAVPHTDCWSASDPRPAPDVCYINVEGVHSNLGNAACELEWHFGFATLEACILWFGEGGDKLDELGHHVVLYEVPPDAVIVHPKQAIFDMDRATVVEAFPCSQLGEKT